MNGAVSVFSTAHFSFADGTNPHFSKLLSLLLYALTGNSTAGTLRKKLAYQLHLTRNIPCTH